MRLLELCSIAGATMYYSGNMDYNGLKFADKLYLKFGKDFKPWRYSKADYEQILTDGDVLLPDKKKEMSLHNEDFASMLSQLRKIGRTASSMPLVPVLVEDIKEAYS